IYDPRNMEFIKDLNVVTPIQTASSTIYIGQVKGQHAIYILPFPSITESEFNNRIRCEDGKLVMRTKVVPRLIYPATEKHISKYRSKGKYVLETYNDYKINDDFLKTSWLDNLVKPNTKSFTTCTEEILFENEHYLIIADYKWDKKTNSSLYLLLIFKNDKYRSLREIDDPDILRSARADSYAQCLRYGVKEEDVCLYFHYRPSYFRLHLHILNISKSQYSLGSAVRNVLLDDVIKNLEMDVNYYKADQFIISFRNE
ncbi:m7GpppX diphosphatase, partial [Pancytospora epiphaga]